MPHIPEDIILIIFRYLHRNKMKLLNEEYHKRYKLDESEFYLIHFVREAEDVKINYRGLPNIIYRKSFDIGHIDKDNFSLSSGIKLPKNY